MLFTFAKRIFIINDSEIRLVAYNIYILIKMFHFTNCIIFKILSDFGQTNSCH